MTCWTFNKPKQTPAERREEIRKTVEKFARGLVAGTVKVVVGKNGGVTFTGIPENERNGVADSCVYRNLMTTGSAMARQMIARAEQMAGRRIDQKVVASGTHSHDGGKTWHDGH